MRHSFSTSIRFPFFGSPGLNATSPRSAFIHTLDDDSLLNVFHLCRPVLVDEDEDDNTCILQGGEWTRERWWYKLSQLCRRWRFLILASASHLHLCLVCTRGTPVAEILEHSPPLPLIIDHLDGDRTITAEDEEGIIFSLQHRHRVRRIRLEIPVPNLQKLIAAIDDEFPILDYLYIRPPTKEDTSLILPRAFRAPHLRHLILRNFGFPSSLLRTTTGLVTLSLQWIHPSADFCPNDFLRLLSPMPQLETVGVTLHSPVASRDVERKLLHVPITTQVTFPNLRWFAFRGSSAYLEALLPWMTTPLLEKLQILFYNQLRFALPHLLQFMRATENLRFNSARLMSHEEAIFVRMYPHKEAKVYSLYMQVSCRHLDWQVASAAQVFSAVRTVFSAVEHLTLEYGRYLTSSEWHNEADGAQWRELLRSFSSVKTLRVDKELVGQLSRSLQSDDGESPLELLPELKELSYLAPRDIGDVFGAFIDARLNAGSPVALVRRRTRLFA
ncbi:hypothetical protein BC827DRAFT_1245653 [Russula dissimulans]|nr:hypothetical protein BC827DRAFT_1245653 [Russula dissimulans]